MPVEELQPSVLAARPEVWEENALVYAAFWDLNAERNSGWGEGVIPWAAIRSYAEVIEVDPLELLRMVRPLDKAYLKHRKQEQEVKAKNDERSKRRGRRS
jgi:hypothetical protein